MFHCTSSALIILGLFFGLTGPNCVVAFFNLFPGNPTLAADPITAVANGNAADCETRCRNDATCLSYQTDRTPGATVFCWFQRDVNAQQWQRPFIDEFVKLNNCTQTFPS